jgi:hypothetical protein
MGLRRTFLRGVAYVAGQHASRQLAAFMRSHQRTRECQQELLMEFLARHRDTAFGRDHGFANIRSVEDFRAAVPVGNYDSHRPYIQRVLHGESTALLPPGEEPMMFSMTSGTTGEPKYIPVTRRFLADIRRGWNIFGLNLLRKYPQGWLRPILQISSPMDDSVSPRGVACGAISGLLARTQKKIVRRMYVVPQPVYGIQDPTAKYYAILRCGIEKDVAIITTANPSSTIRMIEAGQAHAERMIRDVADGTFTPPGEFPRDIAASLKFSPNPALAKKLQTGVDRDNGLMPRHFWNIAFLTNWTGGTLKLYIPRLKALFDDAPVRDIGLLASEGRFSIPLEDETSAGAAEITANFLEFIPEEEYESASPRTLLAHELEAGREYFLVLTNWTGLCRYNLDDRVRVTGFLGQSPVFEFLSRGLRTANITGEKLTEYHVVEAMRRASELLNTRVQRFVVQGRFARQPYYELRLDRGETSSDPDALARKMDETLRQLNIEYDSKRQSDRLGALKALVLPEGTLEAEEIRRIRSRRGRSEQYKHQYLLTEVLSEDA